MIIKYHIFVQEKQSLLAERTAIQQFIKTSESKFVSGICIFLACKMTNSQEWMSL